MMGVAAEAMGAEPGPLVECFTSPIASVRLLRYPPQAPEAPPGMFGERATSVPLIQSTQPSS